MVTIMFEWGTTRLWDLFCFWCRGIYDRHCCCFCFFIKDVLCRQYKLCTLFFSFCL